MTEHNFEDKITYKDIELYNCDNAGSIISTCIINGREMTVSEFKKSKDAEIGANAIIKFRKNKKS